MPSMHRATVLVAAAATVGIVSVSSPAHALGPVDLEVGAKAGVGTNPASDGGPNPLGFGLGARAGLVVASHFYAGGSLMYYFGGSEDGVSVHTLMYGGELGYGVTLLDLLTIRPQIGLGNATFSGDGASTSNLYIEPGVTGLVTLGSLFVGADANLLDFPGLADSNVAFTLHAQVGLKF